MPKLDFKLLVEEELKGTVGQRMISLLTIPGDLTLEKCAIWASLLDRTGVSYIKIDTLLGIRPAWPIIDTLAYIFKVLQGSNVAGTITETEAKKYAQLLNKSNTIKSFYTTLVEKRNLQVKESKKIKIDSQVLDALEEKVQYLFNNYNDYREFFSTKLRQITDKTQIIAAEEYLNLTPYSAVMKLLTQYGGYDIGTVKNILYYPGETRFTQANIEGPVMGSIAEISKLMLLFYREYIMEQKERDGQPIVNSIIFALKVKDAGELKRLVDNSAGKLSVSKGAGKIIQKDYINFVQGRSVLTIDPNVPAPVEMPMNPPKPAIEKIADFRNISGTSQDVYQAFIELFNNIREGTQTSRWKIAGKVVLGAMGATASLMKAITAFSGQGDIYGRVR
jgi:hypothetical protein